MNQQLLDLVDLTKIYGRSPKKSGGQMVALQHFDLSLPEQPAKIITIAGESGSGKTTLANIVLGFTRPTFGKIIYKGLDISTLKKDETVKYRREVQAIFQDPYSVYNPFYKVEHVFDIVLKNFKLAADVKKGRELIEDALNLVNLKGENVLYNYPHQLSGGQLQRIMIARAYMLKPSLIIADEPVSMIDVSLRAMILELMVKLRDEHGISFIYITHDFSTAYQISDEIFILYCGRTIERGNTVKVINHPQHPYTKNLIDSIPTVDKKWEGQVEVLDSNETNRNILSDAPSFIEYEPMHWVAAP
ncbi:MAG: ABC transporter ATP-binding protein [Anaerolineaceae bacterium]